MAGNEHIAAGGPKHGADHHVSDHPTQHATEVNASAFTETEIGGFQRDDYSAGKAVVMLMLGIFGTGVMIYSIVAYSVIS